jgi:hypothetical protein
MRTEAQGRRPRATRRWPWVVLAALAMVVGRPASAGKLLDRVLRILGVSASPGQMKGDDDEPAFGEIWLADLASGSRTALTSHGAYRWPVFALDGKTILALKGQDLITITVPGGQPVHRQRAPGVAKLVGVDRERPRLMLVLRDGPGTPPAIMSLETGVRSPLPWDPQAKGNTALLAHLRGEERVYGDIRLFVTTESAPSLDGTRQWQEVHLQRGGAAPISVSDCKPQSCRQPTLSADGKLVAYIRVE